MRNHILTGVAGLMVGFAAGYLLQETLAGQQPPRLVHDPDAAAQQVAPPAPEAGAAPGFDMEQVRRLRDYVAQNPTDADAVLQLAMLNFQIQRWPRASELFQQYVELRPDSPDVLSDLGICFREMGNFDGALASFDRAQELAPDHMASRFNEVVVKGLDLGDYDGADEVLAELRLIQPGNSDLERLAAEIEKRRGQG